jgi:basic amino acid/polyamine antiporter, APA family
VNSASVLHESEGSLQRLLGRWDLTAIGINQVIGGAVFLVPAELALRLGGWSPLVVLLIGISSMLVGLCFAEAGSRFEGTGGAYLYARSAFGRFAGVEVGWMQWFTRVSTQASVVNGIAVAVNPFLPDAAKAPGRILLILGITLTLMVVNLIGIRQSSSLVNFLTIAKLVPLVGFILIAFWHIHPGYYPRLTSPTRENAAAAALLLVFTFGGFDVIGVPAGESRTPRRDVPFALITTTLAVTLILTLIQVLLLLTLQDPAHSNTPIADAAVIFVKPAGAFIVAVGAVLSMIGNNAGQILSGSRTLFSLAEGGELPGILARIHPRYGTPCNAIVVTTAVALVLALTGSFAKMAAISAVARLAAYVPTAGAVLVMRRKDRTSGLAAARFTIPGGPVVPILALAGCLLILGGATREQLAVGAVALAVGAAVHNLTSYDGRAPKILRAGISGRG